MWAIIMPSHKWACVSSQLSQPWTELRDWKKRLQSAKIKQWIWIVRKWNNSTRLTSNLKFSSPTRENSRFSFGFFSLHSPLLAILRCGCTLFSIRQFWTWALSSMWNCKLIWIFWNFNIARRVVTTRTNFWNANTPRICSLRTENERFYYDKITAINYSITEMSVFLKFLFITVVSHFFVQISNHYAV